MNKKLICALSVLFLLVATTKVSAVERLSAIKLASHCMVFPAQVNSIDGQFCIRYIQGFIDGAIATDERVLLNIEEEFKNKETYAERAARVRGVGASDRAARYAEYCLGEPVSLREVVTRVVDDLKASKLVTDAMARTVVYASLRKHFPCE